MSPNEQKDLVRRYYDTHSPGRLDEADALMTDDFQGHMPGMAAPIDRAGFRQVGEMFFTGFAEIDQQFEGQISEGDRVFSRGTWYATHTGTFMGVPATGKRIAMSWMGEDRIVDGKIAEHWAAMDILGMLQQLGAISSPDAGT
jgi:steroid delta-isomerase-like uncharacterized protein